MCIRDRLLQLSRAGSGAALAQDRVNLAQVAAAVAQEFWADAALLQRLQLVLPEDDDVWVRIEDGAGTRLPYRAVEVGDIRCNRTVWGAYVGERYVPLLDDREPGDLALRDAFFAALPGNLLRQCALPAGL